METAVTVVATLLACIVVLAVYNVGRAVKRRSEERSKAEIELVAALNKLEPAAAAMTKASEHFADVPKLIDGMYKIAKAQALEISKLRLSVEKFSSLVTKPDDNVKAVQQPDEAGASLAFEVSQLLQDDPGMDRDVAIQKARDRMEVFSMNSGIGVE